MLPPACAITAATVPATIPSASAIRTAIEFIPGIPCARGVARAARPSYDATTLEQPSISANGAQLLVGCLAAIGSKQASFDFRRESRIRIVSDAMGDVAERRIGGAAGLELGLLPSDA